MPLDQSMELVLIRDLHDGRDVEQRRGDARPKRDVVVRLALEVEGQTSRGKGAKALAGGSLEAKNDRVLRQTLMPVSPGDVSGQHRSNGSVAVPNLSRHAHRLATRERRLEEREKF